MRIQLDSSVDGIFDDIPRPDVTLILRLKIRDSQKMVSQISRSEVGLFW